LLLDVRLGDIGDAVPLFRGGRRGHFLDEHGSKLGSTEATFGPDSLGDRHVVGVSRERA